MSAASKTTDYTTKKLVLTRTLKAPRTTVFRMWTEPVHLAKWWGPKGFTNPVCRIDARPGGALYIEMRAPDGVVYPMNGTLAEFVEPERLSFKSAALDPDGKPMFETLTRIVLTERDGATTLTLEASVLWMTPGSERYLDGMDEGWNQSLERLQAHADASERGDPSV